MRTLKLYLFLLLTFVINPASAENTNPRILVVGDSLSAAYGIDIDKGWVKLLQHTLDQEQKMLKQHWQIINASVSGETSSGGRTRLKALLDEHQPQVVILELGGNDGLRGQPLKILRDNLQYMITQSKTAGASVILAGMQIPPNYGARYARQFQQLYSELAGQHQVALIPFLLEGIPTRAELMQRDGIHPTEEAQPLIVDNVKPVLLDVLKTH
ncbi:arylesterase [Cellvibrio japonicus]|uniref:Acyl-CoA thioesterase I n=1 Tax=Cellvibrio japonicus (strain Ueda107) TaxID=498211 RepID=B3PEA5_CELJU|nr:arylesterase [Cellvibrio japonicus]ACE83609.1 acyl-CoA thioesterase I [Cellvibrio japonicus Ueda107]QEI12145.1 arylesterase [Cellvibrio japonicus]QEI15719.1 arylesterase [Cellvibrio japonicus]QEI19297.1 arylesterase [Cellvibrio japonicus]